MLPARGTVVPGASARLPVTEVAVGVCFPGSAVRAQSPALPRQELDLALPMGRADVGQTSRSTG